MTVALTYSRAQLGVDAPLVTVEADIASGLPQILIVGLPETTVKESKDRVKAAIVNSGFTMPARRITVNLAPADLPKQGGRYDLAIALAILGASHQIEPAPLANYEFLGELALGGKLRSVNGILPATIQNLRSNRKLVVPTVNSAEAALAESQQVFVSEHLKATTDLLQYDTALSAPKIVSDPAHPAPDQLLSDIRGQYRAKRALTIAAAGCHNLLFIGPPGAGKTMLASRLGSLLPTMGVEASLEVASIQSISKYSFNAAEWGQRPFRTPHHTASAVAMVGGGNPPKPGEISLAHKGVLFLDELPEFSRQVLEVLREPMESGRIVISRAQHQITYPAEFQLISAMNPCPCGYYGDASGRCSCTPDRVERYKNKISGPLLDRIDLHVDVPGLPKGVLGNPDFVASDSEHFDAIKQINIARRRMQQRSHLTNTHLTSKQIHKFCQLTQADQRLLDDAMEKLGLSARGYFKILKIARTIADMNDATLIATPHLIEALSFRKLDRNRNG